jgi:HTH-type transcriptional regulator / antitoxin HigA
MSQDEMRITGVEVLEIDGVDGLLFVMDQQDLKQKDLIPYIGSKSRVSEVLSRKRPLTLQMIRNLYFGLGIPAKVLLQYPKSGGSRKEVYD